MVVKKSIRIQLFDDTGFVSDRMVTQLTEFYAGPKEVHKGPMRIEFTLESKEDAIESIDYLKRLIGDLPLKVKGDTTVRKIKEGHNNDDTFDNDKENIINQILEDNAENQDLLIKELRKIGFIFITSDYLKYVIPNTYQIRKGHPETYQWLVRVTKVAKDPRNDKYDPQVLIGISIMNERSDKVVLYMYGEYRGRKRIPVPDKKPMKLSKTNLLKFPHYMNEEERLKWGIEHRLLFNTAGKKPSKFYMRWYKDVEVGDELKISREDMESRLSPNED